MLNPELPLRRPESEAEPSGPHQDELTDALVQKVADRVYAMLVQEVRIGQERQRPASGTGGRGGGR